MPNLETPTQNQNNNSDHSPFVKGGKGDYCKAVNMPNLETPTQTQNNNSDNPPFVKGGKGDYYKAEKRNKNDFKKNPKYIHIDQKDLRARHLIRKWWHLPYNPDLKERARKMRNNPTNMENKIWKEYLQKLDLTVLRQKPIDNFIADFYIASKSLVIEIDWEIHDNQKEYDKRRTKILEQYGIRVIRFTNQEVLMEFDKVMQELDEIII